MKKLITMMLVAVMALSLTACGNSGNGGTPDAGDFSADLTAFYGTLLQGDEAPMMMEITEDLIENIYPGLSAVERTQSVLYTAAISANACEVAMVEVANAADVETVQAIFQARIDAQVGTDDAPGGAWYPETIEQWRSSSEIVTNGNYVCLFVGSEKDDMVSGFNALGQAE